MSTEPSFSSSEVCITSLWKFSQNVLYHTQASLGFLILIRDILAVLSEFLEQKSQDVIMKYNVSESCCYRISFANISSCEKSADSQKKKWRFKKESKKSKLSQSRGCGSRGRELMQNAKVTLIGILGVLRCH